MRRAAFLGISGVVGFLSGLFLEVHYRSDDGVQVSCGSALADNSCKKDSEGECGGRCPKGSCQRLANDDCGCVEKKKK